jgi:hypothetical protein
MKSPDRRADYVNMSTARGRDSKWIGIVLVVPTLVCVAIVGLMMDFPWLWPLLFMVFGTWMLSDDVRDALDVQRNRPYLPVDEGGLGLIPGQPAPPTDLGRAIQERNLLRRGSWWVGIALVPPLIHALR